MNLHSTCIQSRGGYDTNYDPEARASARDTTPLPILQKRSGRPKIKLQRTLAHKLQFKDCTGINSLANRSCNLNCNACITVERRQQLRDSYHALRSDVKSKAKIRAYQMLLSLIKTKPYNDGHHSEYYLHSGNGSVQVCRAFWANTFGVGGRVVRTLTKLSITDFLVCCVVWPFCRVKPCLTV